MKSGISFAICTLLSASLISATVLAQSSAPTTPAAIELAQINKQIDALQRKLEYAKMAKRAAEISIPLTIAASLSGYFYGFGKMVAFSQAGAASTAEASAAKTLTVKWFAGGSSAIAAEVLTVNLTIPEILKLEVALIKLKLQNLDAIRSLEGMN